MTAINIQKLRNLVNLAVSPSASEGEIRNASVAVVKIINEYKLLDILEKGTSVHQNVHTSTSYNYQNQQNQKTTAPNDNNVEKIYRTRSGIKIKLSSNLNYINDSYTLAYKIVERVLEGMIEYNLKRRPWDKDAFISVSEILEAVYTILLPVNMRFLESNIRYILSNFAKSGKLRGKKGRNGGYCLV